MSERLYVIAYDIAIQRARTRIARLLLGHGERVQRSVYECLLELSTLQVLQNQLQEFCDPKTDYLLIYPLCSRCRSQRWSAGADIPTGEIPDFWII